MLQCRIDSLGLIYSYLGMGSDADIPQQNVRLDQVNGEDGEDESEERRRDHCERSFST